MSAKTDLKINFLGVDKTAQTLRGIIKKAGAALAGAFAINKIVQYTKLSVAAFQEQESSERKLLAVLESTGHAAGKSYGEILKMSVALQKVTSFGDEEILNASALIATFKEIKGEIFDETIKSVLDLSAAMGQDLKSSSVQLGKALNDPIKGITALTRVGVSFTQAQKDQIANLVASNDVMKAQKIILAELQSEFGGSAEKMADPWKKLGNVVSDFAESIGRTITEILDFSGILDTLTGNITDGSNGFRDMSLSIFTSFQYLKAFVRTGTVGLDMVADAAGRLSVAFQTGEFKSAFEGFDGLFGRIDGYFDDAVKNIDDFRRASDKAFADKMAGEFTKGKKAGDSLNTTIKNIKHSLAQIGLAGTYAMIQEQYGRLNPAVAGIRGGAGGGMLGGEAGGNNMMGKVVDALNKIANNTADTSDSLEGLEEF